ncbi:MAG: protein kinase domain-containing protein, partial [Chlamydiota bacterium]
MSRQWGSPYGELKKQPAKQKGGSLQGRSVEWLSLIKENGGIKSNNLRKISAHLQQQLQTDAYSGKSLEKLSHLKDNITKLNAKIEDRNKKGLIRKIRRLFSFKFRKPKPITPNAIDQLNTILIKKGIQELTGTEPSEVSHEKIHEAIKDHANLVKTIQQFDSTYDTKGKTTKELSSKSQNIHQEKLDLLRKYDPDATTDKLSIPDLEQQITAAKSKHASLVKDLQQYYPDAKIDKLSIPQLEQQIRQAQAATTTIQAAFRGHLARKDLRHKNVAATIIQAKVRMHLAKAKYQQQQKAASLLKTALRSYIEQKQFLINDIHRLEPNIDIKGKSLQELSSIKDGIIEEANKIRQLIPHSDNIPLNIEDLLESRRQAQEILRSMPTEDPRRQNLSEEKLQRMLIVTSLTIRLQKKIPKAVREDVMLDSKIIQLPYDLLITSDHQVWKDLPQDLGSGASKTVRVVQNFFKPETTAAKAEFTIQLGEELQDLQEELAAETKFLTLPALQGAEGIIQTHHVYHIQGSPPSMGFIQERYERSMDRIDYQSMESQDRQGVRTALLNIANGLQTLAQENIVHADIKPANLLLDLMETPRGAITDFGCACKADDREDLMSMEGSPAYLPPEWSTLETISEEIDPFKRDIWSMGVSLHQIFNQGKLPPVVSSETSTLEGLKSTLAALNDPGSPQYQNYLQKYPEPTHPLENLIWSCLRPNPQDRPTASELASQLSQIFTGIENGPTPNIDQKEAPSSPIASETSSDNLSDVDTSDGSSTPSTSPSTPGEPASEISSWVSTESITEARRIVENKLDLLAPEPSKKRKHKLRIVEGKLQVIQRNTPKGSEAARQTAEHLAKIICAPNTEPPLAQDLFKIAIYDPKLFPNLTYHIGQLFGSSFAEQQENTTALNRELMRFNSTLTSLTKLIQELKTKNKDSKGKNTSLGQNLDLISKYMKYEIKKVPKEKKGLFPGLESEIKLDVLKKHIEDLQFLNWLVEDRFHQLPVSETRQEALTRDEPFDLTQFDNVEEIQKKLEQLNSIIEEKNLSEGRIIDLRNALKERLKNQKKLNGAKKALIGQLNELAKFLPDRIKTYEAVEKEFLKESTSTIDTSKLSELDESQQKAVRQYLTVIQDLVPILKEAQKQLPFKDEEISSIEKG